MPALDEAATIGDVIRRIPRVIEGVDEIDVLMVNDGNRDDTVAIAEEAGAHVISHFVSKGVGAAGRRPPPPGTSCCNAPLRHRTRARRH